MRAQVEHDHHFLMIEEDLRNGTITLDESILFKFRSVFNPEILDERYHSGDMRLKCLTPTIAEFEKQRNSLSPFIVNEIDGYLNPVQGALANYVTPSGKFMIEYETTGNNAVPAADVNGNLIPDYVEEAGIAADSAYQHEIINLRNSDPIPAGELYSITLADIGPYGYTQREFGGSIATSIVVENDFVGFPDNTDPDGIQLGALRVTIAHELKHAIQYIDNEWRGESDSWLEMDATLMEEVVYDQVNDYYNYIEDARFGDPIFLRPFVSVIPGSYEDITFSLYFHEKFGGLFWADVWTIIRNNPDSTFLEAVQQHVESLGANWNQTLTEMYLWHYASGAVRSASDFGFDERFEYPEPTITEAYSDYSKVFSSDRILSPISAYFYDFIPPSELNGSPKISIIHSNITANIGVIGYFNDGTSDIRFAQGSPDGTTELLPGWNTSDLDRLGVVIVSNNSSTLPSDQTIFSINIDTDIPEFVELLPNFPNPFNPSTNIRFRVNETQNVRINVYDITGRLVQELVNSPYDAGDYTVVFDATGLASGVYIYQLITPTKVTAEKMMLIK